MEFKENTKLQLSELTETEMTETDGGVMLAIVAAGMACGYLWEKYVV